MNDSTLGPKTGSANPSPMVQLSNELQADTTWNSTLEGQLLTFVDATFNDRQQREAVKSLIKRIVRDHYKTSNSLVQRILNQFSHTFEGEKIKYTSFDNPTGRAKWREDDLVHLKPRFHNE